VSDPNGFVADDRGEFQRAIDDSPCFAGFYRGRRNPAPRLTRERNARIRLDEPTPLLGARPPPQDIEPERQRCPEPEGKLRVIGDAVVGKRVDQDVQPFAVEH